MAVSSSTSSPSPPNVSFITSAFDVQVLGLLKSASLFSQVSVDVTYIPCETVLQLVGDRSIYSSLTHWSVGWNFVFLFVELEEYINLKVRMGNREPVCVKKYVRSLDIDGMG